MADALAAYIKHGFPKEGANGSSYVTDIEYHGLTSALYGQVSIGNTWTPYQGRVTTANIVPIEGSSTHSELIVRVERVFEEADYSGGGTGTKTETNYEIDWVDVSRSLFEHPKFAVGGGGTYELTDSDVIWVKKWEKEEDTTLKGQYKFKDDTATIELTPNGKMIAKGINIGIDHWVDKAPICRKSLWLVRLFQRAM